VKSSPSRIVKAYALSIGVWCGLSLLTGWQYHIFDQALNIHSSLLEMLLLAESRGFAFAVLTPPIFYFVRHHLRRGRRFVSYVLAYGAGVVPFMFANACIRWAILPPWDAALQRYVPRAGHNPLQLIQSGFADQITIYFAIVVAGHAFAYFERARKEEMASYEYQRALAASELQALKMQIHPHFFFNTLHGIATLIHSDPEAAHGMMVRLSNLMRTALLYSGADLVALKKELEFVRGYLELERMRFGRRLGVQWHIDPETEEMLVPQMILQPLVENALRHGIAPVMEGGLVEITAQQSNDCLVLRIRNSCEPGCQISGNGVGLRNTRARLRHLYSEDAHFSFVVENGYSALAELRLPAIGSERQMDEMMPTAGY
jgi:histidine kinase